MDGRLLVQAKVNSRAPADHFKDTVHGGRIVKQLPGDWTGYWVARQGRQFLRDALRREDEIDRTRGNCASRHAVELRRVILRKRDAAFRLDGFQSECSVRGGAG